MFVVEKKLNHNMDNKTRLKHKDKKIAEVIGDSLKMAWQKKYFQLSTTRYVQLWHTQECMKISRAGYRLNMRQALLNS